MAVEDIVKVREHGFIEVYPISTRKIGVDSITVFGAISASTSVAPIWPIEDDPDHAHVIVYADEVPGFGTDDLEGNHAYSDIEWTDDGTQLGLSKRVTPGGGGLRYRDSVSIVYFDLSGLPSTTWKRIEFCCDLAGDQEFWNADNYNVTLDYHDIFDTYEEGLGENVTDEDAIPSDGVVSSRMPPATVTDINTSGEIGFHLDKYYVWNDPGEAFGGTFAFPLENDGRFVPGAFRGIRLHLEGSSAPTGDNTLIGNFWFDDYDTDYLLTGEYTKRQALAPVPHLRFWPAEDESEAELMLGLRIEARASVVQDRRILQHQARTRRGY